MADPVITEVAGLQLSNNTFSASPPGSMSKATNGVISQKGVFQPRNGQEAASNQLDGLFAAMTEFQATVISGTMTSKTDTAQKLQALITGTLTDYTGTYNPVGCDGVSTSYARLHFCLASLFLHFCCAAGPKVLEDADDADPRNAGLQKMPNFVAPLSQPVSVTQIGWLPYNSSAAYRSTLKRVTSTGQVLTSPPSERYVVTNRFTSAIGGTSKTGGTATVTLTLDAAIAAIIGIPFPSSPAGTFTLKPNPTGDANFPAGTYTITGTGAANQFTFALAGGPVASAVVLEFDPGALIASPIVYLPSDAVAGDVVQIWRSYVTSSSTIEPTDDLWLVGEHELTSSDISAGHYQFLDYTPQSVLKVPLYTNPTNGDGQGPLGANLPPPIYLDVANFDSRTFYLGTQGQQSMSLQMLGVGSPEGIQNNDTIAIKVGSTTKTYTFKTSPSVAGDVQIISSGLPSYNIAWTTFFFWIAAFADMKNLGVGMYVGTSILGLPGGIRLERFDYVNEPIEVKVSRPKSWTPALLSASFTDSTPDVAPNGLSWGKAGQPEAVPLLNKTTVGVSNYYGRRCFGLRNALIICKEGDGIWSLTGSGGNYSLLQISTANIIAPDCACVFADSVWVYTDQGILRVSDTGGTQCVSRPIETLLAQYQKRYAAETRNWSFAVPYETERRVMFFIPISAEDDDLGGAPELVAFCYSQATNAWTGPHIFNSTATAGVVTNQKRPISGDDIQQHRLWLGLFTQKFEASQLTEERKPTAPDFVDGDYLDIADDAFTSIVETTDDPLVIRLTLRPEFIFKGAGITQMGPGQVYRTKIVEVLGDELFRVAEEIPWDPLFTVTIYEPYLVEAQFLPKGDPASRKTLSRLFTLYKAGSFANYMGEATIETDQIQDIEPIPATFPGFGLNPFGEGPFGDQTPMEVDTNPLGPTWATAAQFFPGFRTNEVWVKTLLQGVGMENDGATGPAGRGK